MYLFRLSSLLFSIPCEIVILFPYRGKIFLLRITKTKIKFLD